MKGIWVLALLGTFFISACHDITQQSQRSKDLVIATGIPIGDLSPYSSKAGIGSNLVELVYPTLFRMTGKMEISPELASQVVIRAGEKDVFVTLKSDSAESVKASVLKAKDSPGGHFQEGLKNLASVEVISPHELVFHLKIFDRAFLYLLSILPIQNFEDKSAPLGSFSLESIDKEQLLLKRIHDDSQKVNVISVRSIASPRRAIRELVAGNIDFLLSADQGDYKFLSDLEEFKVDEVSTGLLYALLENRDKYEGKSSLDWVEINRKIDRFDLLKNLGSGDLEPVGVPIPGVLISKSDTSFKNNKESGLPKNEASNRTLTFLGHLTRDRQLARIMKRKFEDLGIQLTLKSLSPQEFEKEVFVDRKFDLVLFAINIKNPLMTHYLAFHSPEGSNSLNFWGYRNTKFDQLIESSRYEEDSFNADSYLQQAMQVLLEDPPGLFLFWVKTPVVYRKTCSGFDLNGNAFFSSLKDVRCAP